MHFTFDKSYQLLSFIHETHNAAYFEIMIDLHFET